MISVYMYPTCTAHDQLVGAYLQEDCRLEVLGEAPLIQVALLFVVELAPLGIGDVRRARLQLFRGGLRQVARVVQQFPRRQPLEVNCGLTPSMPMFHRSQLNTSTIIVYVTC